MVEEEDQIMKRVIAVTLVLCLPSMGFGAEECRETDNPLECMIDKYCDGDETENVRGCVSKNLKALQAVLQLARLDACSYLGRKLNQESDTDEIAALLDTMKDHCPGGGTQAWDYWGIGW